jgi:transposase
MMDGNRAPTPVVTAGLDLGDRYSYLCLIDQQSAEVMEEGRLRTTPQAFLRRFDSEQQMTVAIEAGTHSPWVSRKLEECGHKVLVANPRKTRLIYGQGRKTDKLDAEKLARLARVDPKLLSPLEHRREASQAHLALIRSREVVVRSRAQLINHVRGTVKSAKNARKRAVVAVARKLSVLLHHLWISSEVYEPLYNSRQLKDRAA